MVVVEDKATRFESFFVLMDNYDKEEAYEVTFFCCSKKFITYFYREIRSLMKMLITMY